jgi:hypothetical protein
LTTPRRQDAAEQVAMSNGASALVANGPEADVCVRRYVEMSTSMRS